MISGQWPMHLKARATAKAQTNAGLNNMGANLDRKAKRQQQM
jgi:hypothetical protein